MKDYQEESMHDLGRTRAGGRFFQRVYSDEIFGGEYEIQCGKFAERAEIIRQRLSADPLPHFFPMGYDPRAGNAYYQAYKPGEQPFN